MQKHPNLREEKRLWRKGYKRVAGVDEAGVGPIAGIVTAAAVIISSKDLKPHSPVCYCLLFRQLAGKYKTVRDSKKTTPRQREYFYGLITSDKNIKYSVSSVSARVIDRIGIRRATELAKERCVQKLNPAPDFIILDGNRLFSKKLKAISHKLIIKADEKMMSCTLASIIAKVTRDRIMVKFARKYPRYGFETHKGYGTKRHCDALKKFGPCEIHRKNFNPVLQVRNRTAR